MTTQTQTWLLRITICALVTIALSYCSLVLLAFLASKGTTFKDFDGAAWTQAIGSVGAILVAVWVLHRQTTHAEQQAQKREAAGIRLKASLLRAMAQIATEVERTAFVSAVDPTTGV